jgi:hypothetical protein
MQKYRSSSQKSKEFRPKGGEKLSGGPPARRKNLFFISSSSQSCSSCLKISSVFFLLMRGFSILEEGFRQDLQDDQDFFTVPEAR